MTMWLDHLSTLQLILAVLGVPSLAALVLAAWRRVVKPSVRFIRRVNSALAQVEKIEAALGPNGGRSLYDKVAAAGKSAMVSQARLSTMLDVVVDRPMFETDARGEFTWVNAAFEKTFETSCDKMAGRGWVNILIPQDRDRVVRDWHHAVGDQRALTTMARYLTQNSGTAITGRLSAQPILDESSGTPIAWMGAIDPVAIGHPHPPAAVGAAL